MNSTLSLLLYLCFFLSGINALIYEVSWLNRIQLVMGHTVYSLSTTLSAYMVGLALGALFVPRLKKTAISPLSLYLLIELSIGIYGLLFSPLLKLIQVPYGLLMTHFHFSLLSLSLIQFVFCSILILIPTFLMGMTLPLIGPFLYPEKNEVSDKISILYGVNTLGAMVGSFLTGFVILPSLGYFKTILLAAGINISLYLFMSFFALPLIQKDYKPITLRHLRKIFERTTKSEVDARAITPQNEFWTFALLFISGFAAMLTQVIWNRLAALSFGPSTYIFSLVTTVVLAGIVIGSWIWKRTLRYPDLSDRFFVLLPLLSSVALMVGNYAFSQSPKVVLAWNQWGISGFWLRTLLNLSWSLFCLLPCTTLLGALFPAGISKLTRHQNSTQSTRLLGLGYALNIGGLIAGALLGSFFLLPHFGVERMAQLLSLSLCLLGIGLASPLRRFFQVSLASCALGGIVFYIVPPFDWALLTSGFFYNRDQKVSQESLHALGWIDPISYFKASRSVLLEKQDDPHATISIHEGSQDKNYRAFKINGKVDGTNTTDLKTTRLLSVYPALLKADARSALIIGLGTGSTAANTLRFPEMKSVKVIEISSAMIEFSRKYFSKVDGDIWNDSRFSVELQDGRSYLEHSSEKYDLIISEPSNPWVDGISSLFTQEYYEAISKRLNPGGVASLWFHTYGLDCEAVQSVLSAAAHAFSSVLVFKQSGDLYLLASNSRGKLYIKPIPDSASSLKSILFVESSLPLVNPDRQNYKSLIQDTLFYDQTDLLQLGYLDLTNQDDNLFLQYSSGKTFSTGIECNDFTGSRRKEMLDKYINSNP